MKTPGFYKLTELIFLLTGIKKLHHNILIKWFQKSLGSLDRVRDRINNYIYIIL